MAFENAAQLAIGQIGKHSNNSHPTPWLAIISCHYLQRPSTYWRSLRHVNPCRSLSEAFATSRRQATGNSLSAG